MENGLMRKRTLQILSLSLRLSLSVCWCCCSSKLQQTWIKWHLPLDMFIHFEERTKAYRFVRLVTIKVFTDWNSMAAAIKNSLQKYANCFEHCFCCYVVWCYTHTHLDYLMNNHQCDHNTTFCFSFLCRLLTIKIHIHMMENEITVDLLVFAFAPTPSHICSFVLK